MIDDFYWILFIIYCILESWSNKKKNQFIKWKILQKKKIERRKVNFADAS